VFTPGSPTKKPYFAVASNLSKAFKGASFTERKYVCAHNMALEKGGKLFVQGLYPDNVFTAGVSFTTLYTKVVHYKGGNIVHVWQCNNNFFTAAFKEVLKSTRHVDLGSEWLRYAMKFMVETKTHYTCFGADVQKLCQDKWHMTHMATYLKCGDTQEETVAQVKAVAECVMTYLFESVGEGDELHYPFEEAFCDQVSPSLSTLLETEGFLKLREIGIEIGTTKSLDDLCMDDHIYDAVFLFWYGSGITSWTQRTVA
jgi:hypothetical protein